MANCETCLKANAIPNCYTGTVTITIGYLDTAYFSTAVIVKIVNTATGKEVLQSVTSDGSGVVTFTAFNLMEHYKLEVLDANTYQPLTIYTNETTDDVTSYSCCVEFDTIDVTRVSDFSLNFEGCTGTSAAPSGGSCCVGVNSDGSLILSNASNIDFVGFNVVDNGDGTVTVNHIGGGTGDVVGPAGATDGNIALYDGVTGKLIKDSTVSGADVAANNAKVGITPAQAADIVTNNAKVSNVTTNLSLGPVTATTMDVDSSDGTDATLIEATTTDAGILGAAKWNEIVANTAKVTNATHTGDVTGSGVLTIANKAVDIAMLNDGTDGELITWDAAGVAATVGAGTAAQVLTSNGAGAAPTFQAPAGGADTLEEVFYMSSGNIAFATSTTYFFISNDTYAFTTEGIFHQLNGYDRTLVGAVCLFTRVSGPAGATTNGIQVDISQNNGASYQAVTSSWLITQNDGDFYVDLSGTPRTGFLANQFFSVRFITPAAWGGTAPPTARIGIKLIWEVA